MINTYSHMKKILFVVLAVLGVSCTKVSEMEKVIESVAALSAEQCLILADSLTNETMPKTFQNGRVVTSNMKWWCSGFFPGTCWYTYMLSGNDEVYSLALSQTERMLDVDAYFRDHDIGFQLMCSAGLAYRNTGEQKYLDAIRRGAELLAARYSEITGVIRSWNLHSYPVIIDNMMNLELLTFAAEKFDVPQWKEIAMSHADITMKNHFREDYSSYHMVDYNPDNGEILVKRTVQGYNDESAWSRGQSWGLYGYTMMYRETGEERYLTHAENIAEYLLPMLADRPVPAWDFDAPADMSDQDDASAAAVIASALIELSTLTKNKDFSLKCLSQAEATLNALASPEYLAEKGEIGGFILKHSCGFYLKDSEVDVPLTYADYYFLEALHRYKSLER